MAKALYYNLLAAALTAPVAVASGLIAWQWQLEGAHLKETALAPHLRFSGERNDLASLRVACSSAEISSTNAGLHLYSRCPALPPGWKNRLPHSKAFFISLASSCYLERFWNRF
jgi:hypothetical protein